IRLEPQGHLTSATAVSVSSTKSSPSCAPTSAATTPRRPGLAIFQRSREFRDDPRPVTPARIRRLTELAPYYFGDEFYNRSFVLATPLARSPHEPKLGSHARSRARPRPLRRPGRARPRHR